MQRLVVGIALLAAMWPVVAGAGDTSKTVVKGELGAKVDEYLERLAGFGFSGAILAAKDGEIILSKGYGLANREQGIPFTPDTVSTIGSITKQFTAAAILKLEMQGKLRVEDRITKFFENVPEDKRGITLHHFLTHTAGLIDGLGDDFDLQATRDWLLDRAMKSKLQWEPGKRYAYSNLGYSLLGMIVEKVSGQPYEQFLSEQLFKPAGMNHTGYVLPKFKPEELAIGYRDDEPWGTVIGHPMLPDGPCWNLRANGGIHSTVGDMYKWHLALEGNKILSPEAKKKMFTSHVPEGPDADSFYGYGWAIFTTQRGTKLIAHNGGNGIFSADFRRYVDENVVFFLAINISEFFVDAVSSQVARVIFGHPYTLPPKTVKLDAETLHRHAGRYKLGTGGELVVTASDSALSFAPHGQDAFMRFSCGRRVPPEVLKECSTRTAAIVQKATQGDYAPLREVFGEGLSLDEITAMEGEQWRDRQARLGSFKGIEVVSSVPYRVEMIATTVRLDFERGSEFVRYGWLGNELAGIRTLSGPPVFKLQPQSDAEFVLMNIEPAYLIVARFQTAASGPPATVVFKTGGGEVAATKVE
jgi:CubicO group peptidase (beta-lactamase class C family)